MEGLCVRAAHAVSLPGRAPLLGSAHAPVQAHSGARPNSAAHAAAGRAHARARPCDLRRQVRCQNDAVRRFLRLVLRRHWRLLCV